MGQCEGIERGSQVKAHLSACHQMGPHPQPLQEVIRTHHGCAVYTAAISCMYHANVEAARQVMSLCGTCDEGVTSTWHRSFLCIHCQVVCICPMRSMMVRVSNYIAWPVASSRICRQMSSGSKPGVGISLC